MYDIIYSSIVAACSWYMALRYIRLPRNVVLYNMALAAVCSGLAEYFLRQYPAFLLSAQLLLAVALSAFVRLQSKCRYGDAVILLFLAFAQYALLRWIGNAALDTEQIWLCISSFCLPVLQFAITQRLQDRFPQSDWRAYFERGQDQPGRFALKKWQMYVIPAFLFAGALLCAWLCLLESIVHIISFAVVTLALFWVMIDLLVVMHAYKRERIALLVEQQYRDEMQVFLNVIRSQRHDYNFHVQTLAGLIRRGDLDECRRYVDALEQDSVQMNAILPVKDPAISATIHNFQLLAAREGIQLHVDIRNDLSQIATNVYETTKILSNLLQNAIDEVKTRSDKSYGIRLSIHKRNEYCVIRVSNQVEAEAFTAQHIGKIYQQGYSTKQGHDGVGLSSVKALLGRYRGLIDTRLEGDVVHFVVRVPINQMKKTEE